MVVNSVVDVRLEAAAGHTLALRNGPRPDRLTASSRVSTSEATDRARSYFAGFEPPRRRFAAKAAGWSMMERHQIEGRGRPKSRQTAGGISPASRGARRALETCASRHVWSAGVRRRGPRPRFESLSHRSRSAAVTSRGPGAPYVSMGRASDGWRAHTSADLAAARSSRGADSSSACSPARMRSPSARRVSAPRSTVPSTSLRSGHHSSIEAPPRSSAAAGRCPRHRQRYFMPSAVRRLRSQCWQERLGRRRDDAEDGAVVQAIAIGGSRAFLDDCGDRPVVLCEAFEHLAS